MCTSPSCKAGCRAGNAPQLQLGGRTVWQWALSVTMASSRCWAYEQASVLAGLYMKVIYQLRCT